MIISENNKPSLEEFRELMINTDLFLNSDAASKEVYYSKRNGTVAEKFKNIATNVAKRVKIMTENAFFMKSEFIKKNIGQTHEVIIETKKDDFYLAHTKNYILCYIKSDKELQPNLKLNVKILEEYLDGAKAELV